MFTNKIVSYTQVSTLNKELNAQAKVLVGGCFDILHLGHVRFLKEAKTLGTVIVALESDESLTKYKGINRPIHKQIERAEILAQLECVDFIVMLPHLTSDQSYFDLTKLISPSTIAVTEGDPQLPNKQKQADVVGARIVVIKKINTPSTTQLVKLLQLSE